MKGFRREEFSDLSQNIRNPSWLHVCVILAPTNKKVDTINDVLDQMVPCGSSDFSLADQVEEIKYLSWFNAMSWEIIDIHQVYQQ